MFNISVSMQSTGTSWSSVLVPAAAVAAAVGGWAWKQKATPPKSLNVVTNLPPPPVLLPSEKENKKQDLFQKHVQLLDELTKVLPEAVVSIRNDCVFQCIIPTSNYIVIIAIDRASETIWVSNHFMYKRFHFSNPTDTLPLTLESWPWSSITDWVLKDASSSSGEQPSVRSLTPSVTEEHEDHPMAQSIVIE